MEPYLLTVFLLQADLSGQHLSERFIGGYSERPACESAGAQYVHTANEAFEDNLPADFEATTFYICSGSVSMEVPRDLWPNQAPIYHQRLRR